MGSKTFEFRLMKASLAKLFELVVPIEPPAENPEGEKKGLR